MKLWWVTFAWIFIGFWNIPSFADEPNDIIQELNVHVAARRDAQGRVDSAVLLDYLEAHSSGPWKLDLGGPSLSVAKKVDLVLDRLRVLDPERAERYRGRAKALLNQPEWVNDVASVLKKSDGLALPPLHEIERLSLTPKSAPHRFKNPLIKELWDQLDDDQRTGAILHWVIAEEFGALKEVVDSKVRDFVAWLVSADFQKADLEEYIDHLKKYQTPVSPIYVWEDIPLVLGSVQLDLNRQVLAGRVAAKTAIQIQGLAALLTENTEIHFHTSPDFIQSASFDDLRFKASSGVSFHLSGPVEFYSATRLASGLQLDPLEMPILGMRVAFPSGTFFRLSESGLIQGFILQGTLKSFAINPSQPRIVFPILGGRVVQWVKPMQAAQFKFEFYDNGQLKKGTLAEDTDFPLFQDKRAVFSRLTPVSFYPNGRPSRGQLKSSSHLITVGGESRDFVSMPVLLFDEEGRVLREDP